MENDDTWRYIDEQRAGLADLFDDLDEAEWATPSLCDGWRVREVAAHLTLSHMGAGPAVWAMLRARGSFNRMIRDTAVRQAELPSAQYAPLLRAMVGSRRTAPGVAPTEPLIDVLVHGQDIARPLGRERTMPVPAAEAAATRVWEMGFPFRARRRLEGRRLLATDCDFSVGSGEPVTGPVAELLMLLTGRPPALGVLSGAGTERLTATRPRPGWPTSRGG
ncbi:MAG TPA: maleylpyruvate isomerase family mycothiol-dependent enzyme [Frankiaceae bacterium]|nr:maleylpyruvate isomerase family mycothiol-dependent enzyme [Frankiaceae bacterium]